MTDWRDVKIDYSNLDKLQKIAKEKEGSNPACKMIKYWSERMPKRMEQDIALGNLPYGYVGDGWPQYKNQDDVLLIDKQKRDLQRFFLDPHCRDIGDAIYQANVLFDNVPYPYGLKTISVMDFGGGYGRLAYPIMRYLLDKVFYFSVDYVPLSLLIAPQFISQTCKGLNSSGLFHPIKNQRHGFRSLPAWDLSKVKRKFHIFVTIHSFQEMDRETVDFYVDFAQNHAEEDAIFYSINIDPKDQYVPNSWQLIFDRGVRFNRDGKYNEKMWRIC